MIRALGRIRTKEHLFKPGDKVASLPKKEEDWLISIGMAERVEETKETPPESTQVNEEEENLPSPKTKPATKKKKAKTT